MKDTNSVGAITEGRVLSALIDRGYTVSIPFNVAKYDLVVEIEGVLQRVQCKTGRLQDGLIKFRSVTVARSGSSVDYRGLIDSFAVFCPELGKVYLVPANICGVGTVVLRTVESATARQYKNSKLAVMYEI